MNLAQKIVIIVFCLITALCFNAMTIDRIFFTAIAWVFCNLILFDLLKKILNKIFHN